MADRFLDRTNKSDDLTGSWTFTNASTTVSTGSGGNATLLVINDYVKPNTTNEWYRVASVTDDDEFELDYNFAQATQGGVTCEYSDVSTNDGTTTGKAFVHVNQYSTDEARSAGDICYPRRGQTHLNMGIDVTNDENGTSSNYISIIADDGTNWAGEGGLARPKFDFGGTSSRFLTTGGSWWWFEDLHFFDSHHSYGNHQPAGYTMIKNCKHEDSTNSFGSVFIYNTQLNIIEDCEFLNNSIGVDIYPYSKGTIIRNTSFDGNGTGLIDSGMGIAIIEDCDFSQVSANTTDIALTNLVDNSLYYNCKMGGTTEVTYSLGYGARVHFMDYDGVPNAHRTYTGEGLINRITGTVRSGGATTSIECEPLDACDDTDEYPFTMYDTWIWNGGKRATYSIWMQATGTWAALPNNTELYTDVYYYSDPSNADRSTVTSTNTISAEDTWTDFNVTCTPSAAGPVRIRAYLKKYESGKKIIIDPLVVCT